MTDAPTGHGDELGGRRLPDEQGRVAAALRLWVRPVNVAGARRLVSVLLPAISGHPSPGRAPCVEGGVSSALAACRSLARTARGAGAPAYIAIAAPGPWAREACAVIACPLGEPPEQICL